MLFCDKSRTAPVSACFGYDRGTPVDRHYIEGFLASRAEVIAGDVLEVGDSSYSRKFSGGKARTYSVLCHAAQGSEDATLVGDLTRPETLPEGAFDCFICAQTLQYTFEIQKALEGAHRLLRPGGTLLVTVPGISQISRVDADRYGEYWRFTAAGMTRLVQPVFGQEIEVQSLGNALAACALLQGWAQEELPDLSLLDEVHPDYPVIVTVAARKR